MCSLLNVIRVYITTQEYHLMILLSSKTMYLSIMNELMMTSSPSAIKTETETESRAKYKLLIRVGNCCGYITHCSWYIIHRGIR